MAAKGKKGAFWDYQFHSNYQHYCKSQERRTPAFQRLRAMATEKFGSLEKLPEPLKKEFIAGSRPLMKYTNILTFNSRAITIYITCLLGIPWLYPILEITVGECLYIYMHREHEKLCKHIIAEIEKL